MVTRLILSLAAVFTLGRIDIAVCADTEPAPQGIVQAAFGGGYSETDGRARIFSFHALQRADGTTEGWYHAQLRLPNPRARIIARLDCLHIVGNVAWLGGVIESATNPDNVGRRLFVKAVDNGEGADANADELGGRWEDVDCTTEPQSELVPVRGGNIEVLGATSP